jgi:hypothetical protein
MKDKKKQKDPKAGMRKCIQSGKCKTPKDCMQRGSCKLEGKVGKYGLYDKK